MSDDSSRPRRAIGPDDSADWDDYPEEHDTNPFARPEDGAPAPQPRRGRRFAEPDDELYFDDEASESDVAQEAQPEETQDTPPSDEPLVDNDSMIPAPVLPERASGVYAGPGPKPRRSALSSVTPPEAPESETVVAEATETAASEAEPWYKAHARTLGIAGIVVGLVTVGSGISGYLSAGSSSTTGNPSPSASASSGAVPRVSQADLITEADVKAINQGATWAITSTTVGLDKHEFRPLCLSTEPSDIARLDSLQRSIGSTEENALAALQQLDTFPSEEAAKQVVAERWKRLSSCNEVPTRLISRDTVKGLGDEAYQITVLQEDAKPRYHTLLLTRQGNIVSILDVFNDGTAISTQAVTNTVKRTTTSLCQRTGCKVGTVEITVAAVPPVEPFGWLIPSDLPRIRAEHGRWTAQTPAQLSSSGTGCEEMTLASSPGATSRMQNTYLMTQDESAPAKFGLDQMVFTLPNEQGAADFASKLSKNIESCKDRVMGTAVEKIDVGSGARAFDIRREVSDTEKVHFQVSIVQRKNRVAYLMTSVTDKYQFTPEHLKFVSARTGARLHQFK